MIRSIVKDSEELRQALKQRWKELNLTQYQVAEDAALQGRPDIRRPGISKYFSSPYSRGALSEPDILWLCDRWMVYYQFVVGEIKQPFTLKIPRKYNKEYALQRLKNKYENKNIEDAPGIST